MAFSRFSAVLALLAVCAGTSELLAREYQEALDSDDACVSSDCALRLLQLRTASLRQPTEQTFEEQIMEATKAAPEPISAPEQQARPQLVSLPSSGQERELPWMHGDKQLEGATQEPHEPRVQRLQEANDKLHVFVDAGTDDSVEHAVNDEMLASKDGIAEESPVSANAEETPFWSQLSLAAQSSPAPSVVETSAPLIAEQDSETPDVVTASAVPTPPLALIHDLQPAMVAAESVALAKVVQVFLPAGADVPPPSAPGSGYDHPTWLQACTKILLDLGSGSGEHVRMMYEPETFTKSNAVLVIQQIFGNPDQRRLPGNESGICVLGMEPDPHYAAPLEELKQKYQARGWNVHFYPFAAWSSDGLVTLPQISGEGAASEPDAAARVRSIDIADFARSLNPSFGVRMMIMDMGGAEYESLAHLLETTMMCQSIIKSLLVSASEQGNVTRWAGPALPQIGQGRSIGDIKKRVNTQHCKGKTTPVMNLDEYAVPLPR